MRAFRTVVAVCVAGWATCALAEDAGGPSLEGRWTGQIAGTSIRTDLCADPAGCKLTLDIVACSAGWCGTRVDDKGACAGPALKLNVAAKQPKDGTVVAFEGRLELASASTPYDIYAWRHQSSPDAKPELGMVGDSGGGELGALRRRFPFSANLVRTEDARCQAVSRLDPPIGDRAWLGRKAISGLW